MMVATATMIMLTMMMGFVSVAMGSPPSPSSLDALLQDYAYRAFVGDRTRTGVVYDGLAPANLTGVRVSAMRVRSGSLRSKGVSHFREFEIPKGVVVRGQYVERLVLVYQNLSNWSAAYYPLPPGYAYAAPLVGLLAYDASDLKAKNLPHLHIEAAPAHPISVRFAAYSPPDRRRGIRAKCVVFDLDGSVNLTEVVSGNVCAMFRQGHFSIVVEKSEEDWKKKKKEWIVVVVVIVGVGVVVGGLGLVGVWARGYRRRKRMNRMEKAAEVGEALRMSVVGSTRAPSATGTRTQPTLETADFLDPKIEFEDAASTSIELRDSILKNFSAVEMTQLEDYVQKRINRAMIVKYGIPPSEFIFQTENSKQKWIGRADVIMSIYKRVRKKFHNLSKLPV